MNNNKSELQNKFPLSPRKLWKKMIGKIIWSCILLLIILPFYLYFKNLTDSGHYSPLDTDFLPYITWLLYFVFIYQIIKNILYYFYFKAYIKRYYYDGEENFITIKKGVFTPSEIHVQWGKIQDVYVDQDILDRILGLYDVHIASATAASSIEAHIDGVEKEAADGLKKFLLDKVANRGNYSNQFNSGVASEVATDALSADLGMSPAPATAVTSQSIKVSLSEEISNDKYPIESKWFALRILGGIITVMSILFFPFIYLAVGIFFGVAKGIGLLVLFMTYFGIIMFSAAAQTIILLLWKYNYAFKFNIDNIYYKEGVLSISEKHMPYSSVQDVSISQKFIERLFGFASVKIENATQQSYMIQNNPNNMASIGNGVLLQGLKLVDAQHIVQILKDEVLSKMMSRHGL